MITEIIKNENGDYYLKRNGQPLVCPYATKVLIPQQNSLSNQTTFGISQTNCGSHCPLFEVNEKISMAHPEKQNENFETSQAVLLCGCGNSYTGDIQHEKQPEKSPLIRA